MTDIFIQILDGFINQANRLGLLPAASIWAFFTLILLTYIVWTLKNQRQGEKTNFEMRMKDAETDNAMAHAVEKMAEQIRELRFIIKCIGGKE